MIAESASRLVSGFIDAGVVVVFLPLLAVALLLARPIARVLGTSGPLAALALASIAAVLAVTLGVRAIGGGFGNTRFDWLNDGDLWSRSVEIGSGWLLNLALFVPAGMFGSLATRRPGWTLLGLAGLSLLIEIIQSVGLLGAPDPADLVANTLGAATGAVLAAIALRTFAGSIGRNEGRARSSTALLMTTSAVIACAGIGWLGLLAGADSRRDSLADELSQAFAGSTSKDIAAKLKTDNGFEQLLSTIATRPSYFGRVGETGQFEGRYPVDWFGFHRCVFVRWATAGFTLRNGSGDQCTVFREHPPDD